MKVLLIAGPVLPTGWAGGVTLMVARLALNLKRDHGVECTVVGTYSACPDVAGELEAQGVAVIDRYLGSMRAHPADFVGAMLAILASRKARGMDLIHTHGTYTGPRLLAALRRVPYIITCHGGIRLRDETYEASKGFMPYYLSAARVTTVSDFMRQRMYRAAGPRKRTIDVIYNGCDIDRFAPGPVEAVHQTLLAARGKGALVAGIVGRIDSIKEPQSVIPLALACRNAGLNVVFMFVGKGTSWDGVEEQLRRDVSAAGLDGTVVFGGVSNDMPATYRQLDCLVHFCPQEAGALVFAEALSCGLPVVGVNEGALAEVVSHGETGYLCPKGQWEIWIGALRALTDGGRRGEMGRAARESAEARFSHASVAGAYARLYAEVVSGGGRPPGTGVSGRG